MDENNGKVVRQALCVTLPRSGVPYRPQLTSLAEASKLVNDSLTTWINVTVEDMAKDAGSIAVQLGFEPNLVTTLLSGYLSSYEDRETNLGLMLPAVNVNKLEVEINPLLILLRKNLILTIHGENVKRLLKFARYADIFLKKIPQGIPDNDRSSIVLARIIDENNEKNFEGLRSIEEQGDEIGRYLVDPAMPRTRLGTEIYKMKHALITYLNILWATLDVVHTLRYGDAELITDEPKILEKFTLLSDDITRQISLSEHMSEVLASGLEVLQSIYNNQLQILNNRLALVITWLTIIGTAVLVPNTLATILSNPAFSMRAQDTGWYIALLAGSTILATLMTYWWIKRKGWMPRKVD